jgi:hypothetical protein
MHSSQMYTPGPAMSFFTCFWLFPQNEHFSRSESPNLAIRSSFLPLRDSSTGLRWPGRRLGDYHLPLGLMLAISGVIPRPEMISSTTP